jgi:hypothetical protein
MRQRRQRSDRHEEAQDEFNLGHSSTDCGAGGARSLRHCCAPTGSQLAKHLVLLYDGAAISLWMDHDPSAAAAAAAGALATALVDAAIPKASPAVRNRK